MNTIQKSSVISIEKCKKDLKKDFTHRPRLTARSIDKCIYTFIFGELVPLGPGLRLDKYKKNPLPNRGRGV